jgi:hypothetical protein
LRRPVADELPYLNRLERDWEPDDLAAVAEYVHQLEDHPGWQALWRLIEDAHQEAWTSLLAGHAGSKGRVLEQSEYARLMGFLSGLLEPQAAQRAFHVADERRRERNRRAATDQ